MGHADYLKLGDHNAICGRCGFKFKASELKEEWQGLYTCSKCWEPRHPMDFQRGVEDDGSVPWSRPDSNADTNTTDISGNTIQSDNTPEEYGDESPTYTWGALVNNVLVFSTDLTANRTLTLAGAPSEGDRLLVYRTGGGAYTLDVGGVYTIPASVEMKVTLHYTNSAWTLESKQSHGL